MTRHLFLNVLIPVSLLVGGAVGNICTDYVVGGTSLVHEFTCCEGTSATIQGGSSGDYCRSDGSGLKKNWTAGISTSSYDAGDLANIRAIQDAIAKYYPQDTKPFKCWKYQRWFKKAAMFGVNSIIPPDARKKRSTTASATRCGDGVCNGAETVWNCLNDCCSLGADPTPTPRGQSSTSPAERVPCYSFILLAVVFLANSFAYILYMS